MLCAAYVEVYVAPVLVDVFVHECLLVLGIHIAEVIGRRTCEAGHGVQLQGEDGLIVDFGTVYNTVGLGVPGPFPGTAEGRFASLRGLVLVYLGQLQGQALLRNHIGHVFLVIDGERLAPVALARENGVAQTVVHLHAAQSFLGHELLGGGDGLLHGKAVEREAVKGRLACHWRVHHNAFLGVEALFADVGTLDEGDDGEVEVLGKGIVATVVGRHGHDGTGAIAGKHIFGNPDGDFLVRKGVDGVGAGKHARNLMVHLAVTLRALLHILEIFLHLFLLFRCGELPDEFALGCQHHEGDTEDGIGAGGEDGEALSTLIIPITLINLKLHFRTFGAAYPVALCLLQ